MHVTDSIPAYSLGCLDADDLLRVRSHLAACPTCQAELLAYQAVADQLHLVVPQHTPPARLRRSVIRRIDQTKAFETRPSAQNTQSWLARLANLLAPVQPALKWAALVVILVLTANNLTLWQKLNQAQTHASQDFRVVDMSGTSTTPGAGGVFLISADGSFGTLLADGLSTLNDQQVYQLWLIKDGKRTNGGIFNIKTNGYGSLVVKPTQSLLEFTSFGVTIEPAGGSPAPAGAKVLGGDL
jgi:anti-sigma-K factor RskA